MALAQAPAAMASASLELRAALPSGKRGDGAL
jgi:hypothetical protein